MDKSGVYKIVNILNNKIYIGSASFLLRRQRTHFSSLRHNSHRNNFLQHDYNKCGEAVFVFEVIEYCGRESLTQKEQEYLDKYYDNQKQCYNIAPKAEHSRLGTKLTDEQKERLSQAHKGLVLTDKSKEILSKSLKQYYKNMSVEAKEEISKKFSGENNPNFGKHLSKETKEKLRKAMVGRKASNETKQKLKDKARRGKDNNKARAVKMFGKDNMYIEQYETIIEAIKINNLSLRSHSNISACCSGKRKTAYGFIWRYAEL